jgi:hypothetical protein
MKLRNGKNIFFAHLIDENLNFPPYFSCEDQLWLFDEIQ